MKRVIGAVVLVLLGLGLGFVVALMWPRRPVTGEARRIG
jgi:hypothetical protein